MTEKELELVNFANSLFYNWDNSADPLTLADAEYTIAAWKADGVDVPDGFTAAYFVQVINGGAC